MPLRLTDAERQSSSTCDRSVSVSHPPKKKRIPVDTVHAPRRLNRFLDVSTELLIYFSAIFAPWAFGTVHGWAITTLNTMGFLLGLLLVIKRCIPQAPHDTQSQRSVPLSLKLFPFLADRPPWLKRSFLSLFALSGLLLLYVLLQAANARASFDPLSMVLLYHPNYVPWLPYTFDSDKSWQLLWQYFALFSGFWSTIHWLIDEEHASKHPKMSRRPFRALALLTTSAGIMALQGLAQRYGGNERLLWIHAPEFLRIDSHFGPFAYRGNASTYFNLVWPVALLFLHAVNQWRKHLLTHRNLRTDIHLWLFPVIGLMILVPAITSSRAGTIVTIFNACLLVLFQVSQAKRRLRLVLFLAGAITLLGLGAARLGAMELVTRIQHLVNSARTNSQGIERLEIYRYSIDMSRNHRTWGIGAGAFASVYGMHRGTMAWRTDSTTPTTWNVWAHSDPLETFLTFGIAGSFLAFGLVIGVIALTTTLLWKGRAPPAYAGLPIALTGFCVHSIVDFPFQIHSLLHGFLLVAALGLTLGMQTLATQKAQVIKSDR